MNRNNINNKQPAPDNKKTSVISEETKSFSKPMLPNLSKEMQGLQQTVNSNQSSFLNVPPINSIAGNAEQSSQNKNNVHVGSEGEDYKGDSETRQLKPEADTEGKTLQDIMMRMKKNAETKQQAMMIEKQRKGKPPKLLKKDDVVYKLHGKKVVIGKKSLYLFGSNTKFRYGILWLVEWQWFDRVIMTMIFLNSMFLAVYDYNDRDEKFPRNQAINVAGVIFTILFTVECVLKILAYGFIVHYKAYLRDGWNWIDFIVVIVGLAEQIPGIPSFRGLRTLRVLRPLRSINSIPSMKNQVTSLIKSLGQLVNVLLFLLFLFVIFGILGMQIFQGRFYQRCRLTEKPDKFGNWPVDPEIIHLCSYQDSDGWFKCPQNRYCGAPQDYNLTLDRENLTIASYVNYGITTFDNLGVAMLTIFQSITLEGWSDLMYMMMDSGSPVLASIYFILLVFLGAFFLMNIILVVIITQYGNTKNEQRDKEAEDAAIASSGQGNIEQTNSEKRENSLMNSPGRGGFLPKTQDNNNAMAETMRKQAECLDVPHINLNEGNQFIENSALQPLSERQKFPQKQALEEIKTLKELHSNNIKPLDGADLSKQNLENKMNQNSSLPNIDRPKNSTPIYDLDEVISHEGPCKAIDDDSDEYEKFDIKKGLARQKSNENCLEIINDEVGSVRIHKKIDGLKTEKIIQKTNNVSAYQRFLINNTQISLINDSRDKPLNQQENTSIFYAFDGCCSNFSPQDLVKRFRFILHQIVVSQIFSTIILSMIVLNTVILALDSYPIDSSKERLFDRINSVLTWVFLGEMALKLIGLGVATYVKDRFNIFDALVVILTVAENIVDLTVSDDQFSQKGAISGFRAVRLFRIFKVARTMKSFQNMIEKIAMSLKDIANFSVLLFLFLFTFTLLGLELFSNRVKFNEEGYLDIENGKSSRPNFDDFFKAFITIFMIMIGDNWPQTMYKHMIAIGDGSGAFFIILQIFGKYVLLNLFLAILLENFEEMEEEQEAEAAAEKNDQNEKIQSSLMDRIKFSISKIVKRGQVQALPADENQQKNDGGIILQLAAIDPEKTGTRYAGGFLEKNIDSPDKRAASQGGDPNETRKIVMHNTPETKKVSSGENGGSSGPNETQKIPFIGADVLDPHQNDKIQQVDNYSLQIQQQSANNFQTPQQEQKYGKMKSFVSGGNSSALDKGASIDVFQDGENADKNNVSSKKKEKRRNLMEALAQPQAISLNLDTKLSGKVLYCLGPENKFRLLIARLVTHKYFDPFIMCLIFISTILMAIDSPLNDPDSKLSQVLNIIDIVITSFFVLESITKIIVYGLIFNGSNSYLRISWNVMDFIIVIFSLISIIFSSLKIDFIKVIRMLRVLRPLRMISRNEGLKIAVISLINAIPQIINALVIALLFYVLFAIFGTTYFKGRFFSCLTDNIEDLSSSTVIVNKWDCLNSGGDWINSIMNFDNILQSLASLFVLSSTEGWGDIMFQGVDATDIDLNPVEDQNIAWAFFFISFMVIGSLFMLNLFVSIVVNTYYGEKEKLYKNGQLSKFQKLWLQIQAMCFDEEPEKIEIQGGNWLQQKCISMAKENSWFDYFILACIILNTILMSISWYGSPGSLESSLEYVNYVFTAIFTFEAIIKLIAFGPKDYFSKGWNIFDFTIVLISYITLIIGLTTDSGFGPKQATVARAFRIGRIFRLITKAKFLRVIFNTIIITLPSLANVGALMILLLFIFSILGVQIFATVKLQDTLNQDANFQYFGIAFLTLIRLQTGEGWNAIMMDTLRQKDVNFDCDPSPSFESIKANNGVPNGCGSAFSYLFFVLFTVIVSIIFLNLFVAVILNGFTSSNEEEGISKFKEKIDMVKKIWQEFDPEATGFISVNQFEQFLCKVEAQANTPDDSFITVPLLGNPKEMKLFISHLQVPTYHLFQKYYFQDIISMLCKKYLQSKFYMEMIDKMKDQMTESQMVEFKQEKEREFDDEIDEIHIKALEEKIQMIEENIRMTQKYHKRMFDKVDQFDGKIYDSSYIIWVPVIQMRLRPWVKRYKERKAQSEMDRQQVEEELNNMSSINGQNRLGTTVLRGGQNPIEELIIETGSQLVSGINSRRELTNLHGNTNQDGRYYPSNNSRSIIDDDVSNLGKNMKGQTTGEVGGTLFGDEAQDNSRLEPYPRNGQVPTNVGTTNVSVNAGSGGINGLIGRSSQGNTQGPRNQQPQSIGGGNPASSNRR